MEEVEVEVVERVLDLADVVLSPTTCLAVWPYVHGGPGQQQQQQQQGAGGRGGGRGEAPDISQEEVRCGA